MLRRWRRRFRRWWSWRATDGSRSASLCYEDSNSNLPFIDLHRSVVFRGTDSRLLPAGEENSSTIQEYIVHTYRAYVCTYVLSPLRLILPRVFRPFDPIFLSTAQSRLYVNARVKVCTRFYRLIRLWRYVATWGKNGSPFLILSVSFFRVFPDSNFDLLLTSCCFLAFCHEILHHQSYYIYIMLIHI